jgi:hypothetical protein
VKFKLASAAMAVLATMAALASSPAFAAYQEADFATAGDQLLTIDTDSGLAWLDITATRGQSLAQVLGSSWMQQGFRLATGAEFAALVERGYTQTGFIDMMGGWAALPEVSAYAGGPSTVLSGIVGDAARADGAVPMQTVLVTRATQIHSGGPSEAPEWLTRAQWGDGGGVVSGPVLLSESIRAYVGEGGSSTPISEVPSVTVTEPRYLGTFVRRRTEWVNPQEVSQEWGVFLVKSVSAVPEAGSLAMMGLGLLGVVMASRRSRVA